MQKTIVILILSAVFSVQAFADVLISTLGQSSSGSSSFVDTTRFYATDFLTGQDATTLTLATLNMRANDSIAHTIQVEIWSNSSGAPGSLFNAFDTPISISSGSASFTDYTASDPGISLAANTIYWLVFRVGENPITFPVGAPDASVTAGQDVNPGGKFSEVAATDYKDSFDSGSSWVNNGTDTPIYQLEGTVVPEPATTALILLGVAGVLLQCRRTPSKPSA